MAILDKYEVLGSVWVFEAASEGQLKLSSFVILAFAGANWEDLVFVRPNFEKVVVAFQPRLGSSVAVRIFEF